MRLTKYAEVESLKETGTVELPIDRDGTVTVYSFDIQTLPLDIDIQLDKILPPPARKPGMTDEKFASLTEENERLQSVATIERSLLPGQMEFDTPESLRDTDPRKYYEGLLKEFEDLGFGIGHFRIFVNRIETLNRMTDKSLKAAEGNFSTETT